jgi:HNH endonuclease
MPAHRNTAENILRQMIPHWSGCILWGGQYTRGINGGYGQIVWNRKVHRAHRLAFEQFYGPIPAGLCVLHRCDVRNCVNPAHLFLGTNKENTHDAVAKGRFGRMALKRCPNGHEFTAANTGFRIRPNGARHRECIACVKNQYIEKALKRGVAIRARTYAIASKFIAGSNPL